MTEKSLNDYNSANPAKKAARIKEIRCSYGLLSCFEPETLKACFEIFSENTVAEGAKLKLEIEPLACKCQACDHGFHLTSRKFICPNCESASINFSGGNGLVLQAIDVEEDNSND